MERLVPLLRRPAPGPTPLALIPLEQSLPLPVALASDAAFHFRYPEMQDCWSTWACRCSAGAHWRMFHP